MADIQKLYEQWLAKATADPDLKAELESIKDDEDGKNDRFYRDLGGLVGVLLQKCHLAVSAGVAPGGKQEVTL